jgi:hypothetical protein
MARTGLAVLDILKIARISQYLFDDLLHRSLHYTAIGGTASRGGAAVLRPLTPVV